jgi:hypothetical protein
MKYNRCDFKGALDFLSNTIQPDLFEKTPQTKIIHPPQIKPNNSSKLSITKTKPLQNIALIEYLKNRAINPTVAKSYITETYYKVNDKNYF